MLHSVGLLFDLEEPRVERLYGTKQWQRNQNEKIYDENILCDKMQVHKNSIKNHVLVTLTTRIT